MKLGVLTVNLERDLGNAKGGGKAVDFRYSAARIPAGR